jgi:hypothetical protein
MSGGKDNTSHGKSGNFKKLLKLSLSGTRQSKLLSLWELRLLTMTNYFMKLLLQVEDEMTEPWFSVQRTLNDELWGAQ